MQNMKNPQLKVSVSAQGGFSLIELAIVIAIAVVLVIAGVTLGGRLMTGANVEAEVQSVGMMVTNVRNLYQRRVVGLID